MTPEMIHGDSHVRIDRCCVGCGQYFTVIAPAAAYERWQAGEAVQNALPMLSDDDRELLISGTCGGCWAAMFPEPEEED